MWEFYLCYCEGGFRERIIGTVQLALAKPGYRFAAPPSGRAHRSHSWTDLRSGACVTSQD